jgi:glycosyltransferase involved in cell wall biosynthesis
VRILVYLNALELGGAQLNAIDLARSVRAAGHDVLLVAKQPLGPAPAADVARQHGLRLQTIATLDRGLESPLARRWLVEVARDFRPDVVHTYEAGPAMDAFLGAHRTLGVPQVMTVYAMTVPRYLPQYLPMVVGTEGLAEAASRRRSGQVHVVEPPVDTDIDRPGAVGGAEFRQRLGVAPDERLVVVVSRLAAQLKMDGLVAAMASVEESGIDGLRLAVVGTGPAEAALTTRAAEVNARLGRTAITMAGPLADPRPAYEAADVVLGMGSSALRGMAFAKPVIVLGEHGFSRVVEPGQEQYFRRHGFYGRGKPEGADLSAQLRSLLADPLTAERLGRYARDLVLERYALPTMAERLTAAYEEAAGLAVSRRRRHQEAIAVRGRRLFFRYVWAPAASAARLARVPSGPSAGSRGGARPMVRA